MSESETRKTLIAPAWNPNAWREEGLIRDDETLVAAFGKFGREIPVIDDGFGPLWAYSQEFGPMYVVRAQTFESALEAVYDEMPTIPADEEWEAYGFDSEEEFRAHATKVQSGEDDEYPDLAEGYSYQANSCWTGIVYHGPHEGLTELTNELVESLEISIVVESEDA